MEHSDRTMASEPAHNEHCAPRDPNATRDVTSVYAPPRLAVFGNLERLTTKVGSKGKKDHSGWRRTGF
ncbi:MAG TPA: hypothetical protein VMV51_09915 [Gemmatimonadaceae bacterium]|nr:hypothetical protein [Gemmatimonadaceae bacterium]